jgi:hypothetical protein
MTQHYSNPSRANDPHALPDVETFFVTGREIRNGEWPDLAEVGWYYWFCYPGCMPDGEPIGPFSTEEDAVQDFTDDMPWDTFGE